MSSGAFQPASVPQGVPASYGDFRHAGKWTLPGADPVARFRRYRGLSRCTFGAAPLRVWLPGPWCCWAYRRLRTRWRQARQHRRQPGRWQHRHEGSRQRRHARRREHGHGRVRTGAGAHQAGPEHAAHRHAQDHQRRDQRHRGRSATGSSSPGTFTSIKTNVGQRRVNQRRWRRTTSTPAWSMRASGRRSTAPSTAVEASPDGTKLFVAGTFNTVGGVDASARSPASTRRPVPPITALHRQHEQPGDRARGDQHDGVRRWPVHQDQRRVRRGLAAVNADHRRGGHRLHQRPRPAASGRTALLTVQQLKLTHDGRKLLVVHTGRQITGQDRYGVGADRHRHQAAAAVAHAPVGGQPPVRRRRPARLRRRHRAERLSYFVVTSGSGGDRPPINDTAIAFPIDRRRQRPAALGLPALRQRVLGRHHREGRLRRRPLQLAGVADLAGPVARAGQRRATAPARDWRATASATSVVRRDHLGALDPATGKALEWNPGSNSYEGNKAMVATPRGLFVGGDGNEPGRQDRRPGRVLRPQHGAAAGAADTTITKPIEGRVQAGQRAVRDRRARRPRQAGVAASRSRSRTAAASSTSRTT